MKRGVHTELPWDLKPREGVPLRGTCSYLAQHPSSSSKALKATSPSKLLQDQAPSLQASLASSLANRAPFSDLSPRLAPGSSPQGAQAPPIRASQRHPPRAQGLLHCQASLSLAGQDPSIRHPRALSREAPKALAQQGGPRRHPPIKPIGRKALPLWRPASGRPGPSSPAGGSLNSSTDRRQGGPKMTAAAAFPGGAPGPSPVRGLWLGGTISSSLDWEALNRRGRRL